MNSSSDNNRILVGPDINYGDLVFWALARSYSEKIVMIIKGEIKTIEKGSITCHPPTGFYLGDIDVVVTDDLSNKIDMLLSITTSRIIFVKLKL